MKARVHVFYKDSVFDPQGHTIAESLQRLGFSVVDDVRVGKAIDVILKTISEDQARREIQKMCDQLLVNPVIESYRIEFLKTS